jgi:hypothetical protein
MNPLILKVIHIAGALGVFTAMGAILMGAQESCRKCASMLHGISLLLLLLAGFAMLKKPPMELHFWKVKLVLWLFLGVAPVLARKKTMPMSALLVLTLLVGVFAAYLGVMKPF